MKSQHLNAIAVTLAMSAASLGAGIGVVDTRDGVRHEGLIRLESNGVTVVKLDQAKIRTVALTNLQSLWFRTPPDVSVASRSATVSHGLGAHWRSANVGSHPRSGMTDFQSRILNLASSGTNILGRRDSFHFSYVPWTGDGELVAQLYDFRSVHDQSCAGLMMRESLDEQAANVFLGMRSTKTVMQWRAESDASTRHVALPARVSWMRLQRAGNQFAAYTSGDGARWHLVRRETIPMSKDVFLGLAVAGGMPLPEPNARQPARFARGVFGQVRYAGELRFASRTPVVSLRSGSMAAGDIASVNERELRFFGRGAGDVLPLREVSRIDFRWVPHRWHRWLREGQPGVLLANGEFVEGRFRGIEQGDCVISSVLFGLKRFELDGQVLSVVFGKPALATLGADFAVETWEGSKWQGRFLRMDAFGLELHETSLGRVVIPYYELKSVSRLSSSLPSTISSALR